MHKHPGRARAFVSRPNGRCVAALAALSCARLVSRARGHRSKRGELSSNDFFQLWLDRIEPKLPQDRAAFVTEYPPEHAALAVIDTGDTGTRFARRFEVFAGGLELANAFCELTDAAEQRQRFATDSPDRAAPAAFLDALDQGLPPSGGIALGVDRLVMLLADEPDIRKTVWLDAHVP